MKNVHSGDMPKIVGPGKIMIFCFPLHWQFFGLEKKQAILRRYWNFGAE